MLFEPRSNTTVTRQFQGDLTDAFRGVDELWLGPIYRVEKIALDERLDRAELCAALEAEGGDAHQTDDVSEISRAVLDDLRDGDVVLILSNGAFGGIYKSLRDALAS